MANKLPTTIRAAVGGPHTFVIGDLHLSPTRPDITDAFAHFLQHEINGADALYIVGDLFETWIGDDDTSDFNLTIAKLLHRASAQLPIYFCHGNRDFLLGEKFAALCGMTLLPEPHCVDLYDKRALILHGDSLCTDDAEYQKFRKLRNRPWFRLLLRALPLRLRRHLAQKARSKSQQQNQHKDSRIMDVNAHAVAELMAQHQAEWLIHGHTHKPAIHDLPEGKQRLVVGDWYSQDSVLVITPDSAELSAQPLPPQT